MAAEGLSLDGTEMFLVDGVLATAETVGHDAINVDQAEFSSPETYAAVALTGGLVRPALSGTSGGFN